MERVLKMILKGIKFNVKIPAYTLYINLIYGDRKNVVFEQLNVNKYRLNQNIFLDKSMLNFRSYYIYLY